MPMPFDCMDLAYMLDSATSTLYTLNLVTGVRKFLLDVRPTPLTHTLIYNDLDQLLYFYDVKKHQLCKLDVQGKIYTCPVNGLPEKVYQAIALNPQGILYLYENLDSHFYALNLDETAPDYLVATSFPIPSLPISSWCAHPHLPYLYTLSTDGQVLRLDPSLDTLITLTTHGIGTFSTYEMLFDYDGFLYVIDSSKGAIYRITIEDEVAVGELLSTLDFSLSSACLSRSLLSPLLISLGTAPIPYTTSFAENGPRHVHTDLLTLHSKVPIPNASLASPIYEVTIDITNQTGVTATLYGWIDWNQSGQFEQVEALEPVLIPSLLNTPQKVTLSFKRPPMDKILLGHTYMRLRLTTDQLEVKQHALLHIDHRSLGPASDGEVLDLPLLICAPEPIGKGPIYEKVLVGDLLESCIEVSDPCEGALIYALESGPARGKVNLNESTGHFTYTPSLAPLTQDSFTISATSLISHLSVSIPVQVNIEQAALQIDFVPSHQELTLQDTLTYMATLRNIGSLPLENLLFTASLPEGMTYEQGSVMINGISDLISIPTFGISLVKLLPGELCTIAFTTLLLEAPPNNMAPSCEVKCTYALTPLEKASTLKATQIAKPCVLKRPSLHMKLIANTDSAFLEDLIQYTVTLTNTGDLPLTDIHLSLALPLEIQYRGDFTLDHTLTHSNLLEGYLITSMSPKETHQLQFKAAPTSSSSIATLTTILFTQYTYTLNHKQHTYDGLTASHSLTLHQPSFTLTKRADKTAINLGECFTYTLSATNDSEVPIKEVVLKENIPSFLKILSIKQNKQPLRNTLTEGMSIGDLPPHTTKHVDIELMVLETASPVKILSYPTVGMFKILSGGYEKIFYVEAVDEQGVLLTCANLLLTKSTKTQDFVVGETITYEITATNVGTLKLTHLKVEDLLAPELKFITGSVFLDQVPVSNASIISGVSLDTLNAGASKVLTFDALILDHKKDVIENICSGYYSYLPYGTSQEKMGFVKSEPHQIHILNPQIEITGSVSQSIAYLHDHLDYTLYITNKGDIDAFNVVVQNTSCCTTLIDGSFKINGTLINSVELGAPINVGSIPKGDTTLITFSTLVTGSLHHEDAIINEVCAKFMYYICDHSTKYMTCPNFKLTIPLTPSTFKQVSLEQSLELPLDKPDIDVINTIGGQISLLKSYIIKTPKGIAIDGQTLTGSKLMVHALFEMSVEYASNEIDSCICTAHYTLPFSTFIILPENATPSANVPIDAKIQNVSWRVLNNRCFFACASILVMVRL
ncbi:MAG: DUF11 domain-containing protein [Niameybacter sp.]